MSTGRRKEKLMPKQEAANRTQFTKFLGFEHGHRSQKAQIPNNETRGDADPKSNTIPAGTQAANMKHDTSKSADQPQKPQPAIKRLRAFMRSRF
jgi:hypothetical protein